jgi:hypothetical protein
MTAVQILQMEVQWFLLLLAATLGYRMLTRRIPLNGLLANKADGQQVSPERVQLLLATMALSAQYLGQVAHGNGATLPDVSANWLIVFGTSSGLYAATKAARIWLRKIV